MSATAAAREDRPGRGFGSERVREALVGYLFIAAPMVVFGILFFYPIGYAIYISRYDWGVLGKIDTVGFGELPRAAARPRFGIAIRNGLKYTLAFVICSMALGLFVAVVVNRRDPLPRLLPLRLLLPLDRLVGGDHGDRALHPQADGLFNRHHRASTARGSASRRRRCGRSSA